jgi:uncharacterized membrane protein
MEALHDILMFLGSSVCHQIAERSYTFGDYQTPLCARCLGFHVGFLLSAAYIWAGPLRRASGLPSRRDLVVLGLLMSVAFADAVLSYSGLSPSDNPRRTLSGLCLGVTLPFVVLPLLNMAAFPGRDPRRPISRPRDWFGPAAAYALGAAAILGAPSAYVVFVAVSVAGIVGLFMFFSCVLMAILSLALEKRRIGPRWLALLSVAVAASVLLASALVHNTFLPDV